jgi:NADH:ubiquinone oxidoreductase subunit H
MLFFLVWNIVFLIESQRAPFDLAEGESELVSGFNVEYAGLLFTYFFLAEYGNLIALALISTTI